jgi:hypothetical protein
MNLTTIVGHVGGPCKGEDEEQRGWRDAPAKSTEIKAKIKGHLASIFEFLEKENDTRTFDEAERGLNGLVFTLARLFVAYFLARRHEASGSEVKRWLGKGYHWRKPERKYLNTFFGRVTFWRTYVRRAGLRDARRRAQVRPAQALEVLQRARRAGAVAVAVADRLLRLLPGDEVDCEDARPLHPAPRAVGDRAEERRGCRRCGLRRRCAGGLQGRIPRGPRRSARKRRAAAARAVAGPRRAWSGIVPARAGELGHEEGSGGEDAGGGGGDGELLGVDRMGVAGRGDGRALRRHEGPVLLVAGALADPALQRRRRRGREALARLPRGHDAVGVGADGRAAAMYPGRA